VEEEVEAERVEVDEEEVDEEEAGREGRAEGREAYPSVQQSPSSS